MSSADIAVSEVKAFLDEVTSHLGNSLPLVAICILATGALATRKLIALIAEVEDKAKRD
jgi:hypothetical protein